MKVCEEVVRGIPASALVDRQGLHLAALLSDQSPDALAAEALLALDLDLQSVGIRHVLLGIQARGCMVLYSLGLTWRMGILCHSILLLLSRLWFLHRQAPAGNRGAAEWQGHRCGCEGIASSEIVSHPLCPGGEVGGEGNLPPALPHFHDSTEQVVGLIAHLERLREMVSRAPART